MIETIVITGANRGIGLELSRVFAKNGWQVIACCRNPDQALALEAIRAAAEARVRIHRLDVTEDDQIEKLRRELSDTVVDILLNNAGIQGPEHQDFGILDEMGWLDTFRVNTIAPYKMAVALVDRVALSRRRVIATIGSVMGSLADNDSGGYYSYRTSKAAVHMVMRNLSHDLQGKGITAVSLHPGWVRTDLGGVGAPLSAGESAAGLYRTLLALKPADNGRFLDYRGEQMAW